MSRADLDALFDAAARNPKAGMNIPGKGVGKHNGTKRSARQHELARSERLRKQRERYSGR